MFIVYLYSGFVLSSKQMLKNSKNTTSISFLSPKIEVIVIMTEVEPSNSVTLKYSLRIIIITIFFPNKENLVFNQFIIVFLRRFLHNYNTN